MVKLIRLTDLWNPEIPEFVSVEDVIHIQPAKDVKETGEEFEYVTKEMTIGFFFKKKIQVTTKKRVPQYTTYTGSTIRFRNEGVTHVAQTPEQIADLMSKV